MNALILLLLWFAPLMTFAQPTTNALTRAHIRNLLREAREAFMEGSPEKAAEAAKRFGAVADLNDTREHNVDALRLAEGMAQLRAGKPAEALKALETIRGFDEARERSRLRLLRGNAHHALAEEAVRAEKWSEAKENMGKAIENYIQALIESPESDDARHNLELSRRRLAEILRMEPPPPPTPTPSPTPQPRPSPSPQPTPSPQPQPPGQPTPTPDPLASPTPQPGGTPTPDPQATPEPGEGETNPQENSADSSQNAGAEPAPEGVDPREAERILDAFLQQERGQRDQLLRRQLRTIPVEKDW